MSLSGDRYADVNPHFLAHYYASLSQPLGRAVSKTAYSMYDSVDSEFSSTRTSWCARDPRVGHQGWPERMESIWKAFNCGGAFKQWNIYILLVVSTKREIRPLQAYLIADPLLFSCRRSTRSSFRPINVRSTFLQHYPQPLT